MFVHLGKSCADFVWSKPKPKSCFPNTRWYWAWTEHKENTVTLKTAEQEIYGNNLTEDNIHHRLSLKDIKFQKGHSSVIYLSSSFIKGPTDFYVLYTVWWWIKNRTISRGNSEQVKHPSKEFLWKFPALVKSGLGTNLLLWFC